MGEQVRQRLVGDADDSARPPLIMGVSASAAIAGAIPVIPCANRIPVITTFTAVYPARAAATVVGTTTWRVAVGFAAPYPASVRKRQWLDARYDVREKTPLTATLDAPYPARVTRTVVALGASTLRRATALSGAYDVGVPVRRVATVAGVYPVRLATTVAAGYGATVRRRAALAATYSINATHRLVTALVAAYPVRVTAAAVGPYRSTQRRVAVAVVPATLVTRKVKTWRAEYDVRAVNRRTRTVKVVYNVTKHITVPMGTVGLREVRL